MGNNHYNIKLRPYASFNRTHSTKAEIRLWCEVLRAGKTGFTFLRQRPVLNYIADFMCKELKLIIEVDGFTHTDNRLRDKLRDEKINEIGFAILRFSDEDVFEQIEQVKQRIEDWINRKLKNHPP
jgi:very-short-patch-repair endonuclease